ncbi:MAG: glycosyltransferase family 39 protein, partial [Candidatus Omnitrophica bacterium]|nr:glycosyltransferase family 39 protein [Candidatus Omnitrophota bacterium]
GYIIPSRPPFFNIVCFFYLSIIGGEFYKYQIISTFLNYMLILSVYLFCKKYLKLENENLFLIISIIMFLNPAILRQITYTWTKAFCAFYIILGLYFYLKFLNYQNNFSLLFSGFLFGISFIVHFSAGCFILPVFLHLIYRTFLNRTLIKNSILFYLIFLFIIFTYFSWAIKNYGIYKAFLSTNTYQQQRDLNLIGRIEKDIFNLFKTLYPLPIKTYTNIFRNSGPFYRIFNYLHSVYLCTLPGSLTFSLTFFLLFFLFKFKNYKKLSFLNFWSLFFFLGYLLGIIVMPVKELSGFAHIGLLPLISLIICFGMKYIFTLDRKKFFIFSGFYIIESLFIQIIFLTAFITYSSPQTIFLFAQQGKVDILLVSNFFLKYYNQLSFLYDKIFF